MRINDCQESETFGADRHAGQLSDSAYLLLSVFQEPNVYFSQLSSG